LLVLHQLAAEVGLDTHLGPYAGEILSMVYAHCLNYKSVNHMQGWFARTDLNFLPGLEQLTESRLLSGMDFLEKDEPEQLQRAIFRSVQDHYSLKTSGVICDVTNNYLYGKHCELGKLGHDKEAVAGRPLVQIGLGVTQDEGIPLFHKTFDGNIANARTLQDLITSFGHYGLKSGTIVYYRGITSGKNFMNIQGLGWNTIGGIPLTPPLQKFWRPRLRKATARSGPAGPAGKTRTGRTIGRRAPRGLRA